MGLFGCLGARIDLTRHERLEMKRHALRPIYDPTVRTVKRMLLRIGVHRGWTSTGLALLRRDVWLGPYGEQIGQINLISI